MKWIKNNFSVRDVKFISNTYNIDLLLSTIFARRNIIDRKDVMFYLENDLTYLHSPFAFSEMEDFVDRIHQAKENNEKVAIHGDRDVDGITSTSLLYNRLKEFGIDVIYYVPLQDEPYGLSKISIDNDIKNNINLIITVDCGITSIDEVDYANKNNIDVIIIDHHLPSENLPDTVATINPKVKSNCYPFDGLAACAVVSKCIWALNFSLTPLYSNPMVFIFLEEENDYIKIEVMLMNNLNVISFEQEIFELGKSSLEASKLYDFCINGYPIYCLDVDIQKRLMKQIFGKNYDIHLIELRDEFEKYLPALKGLSFIRIKSKSRSNKYFNNSNIRLLEFLFKAYIYKKYDSLGKDYDKLLDLVAIGTISDMMPLVDENRILVKRGLKILEKSSRIQLTELLLASKLIGKEIVTKDISWGISPIINSSGRMGQANIAIELLTTFDTKEIQEKTEALLSLNKKRKKLGEDIWPIIEKKAKQSYEDLYSKLILVFDDKLARGITGIMAARLMQKFNCPVIVISQVQDNLLIGSGRCKEGFNIRNFFAEFSTLFEDFGGHPYAGGFSMPKDNLDKFYNSVKDYVETHEINTEEEQELIIDANIPHNYMKTSLINLAHRFEPYGNNCEPLNFLTESMLVKDVKVLSNSSPDKKAHLRLTLECNNILWTAMWWEGEPNLDNKFSIGDKIDVVYRLTKNYFRQQESIQLTVLDAKKVN